MSSNRPGGETVLIQPKAMIDSLTKKNPSSSSPLFLGLSLQTRTPPKTPQSLSLGQKVIGRNNDSWYYHCTIVGIATQTLYEVNFDDGSYCDNVHPENLMVSFCCMLNAL